MLLLWHGMRNHPKNPFKGNIIMRYCSKLAEGARLLIPCPHYQTSQASWTEKAGNRTGTAYAIMSVQTLDLTDSTS